MDEKQRTENFERMRAQLESEGYRGQACTISILKANVMAFVTAGPWAALCVILYFVTHRQGSVGFSWGGYFLFLFVMVASIFVHECLHGIAWSLCCKNGRKSIHIGVWWKKLTPYCCCMEALSARAYLFGGLAPFVVLGFGMFAVAMLTGQTVWLWLNAFNILAAGGDTTIALLLLRHMDARIVDHPTECGFWAFEK